MVLQSYLPGTHMEDIQMQHRGTWPEYGASTIDEAKPFARVFHVFMTVAVQHGINTMLLEQVHELIFPAKFHGMLFERFPDTLHAAIGRTVHLIKMVMDQDNGSRSSELAGGEDLVQLLALTLINEAVGSNRIFHG